MVASNVMELDAISVKVVQNGHAKFVANTVIRLRTVISEIARKKLFLKGCTH